MAAVGFIDSIGLVGSLLGIIEFGKDNFPTDPPPMGTMISVKAGIKNDLTNAGGGIDKIYCYDADNEYLGSGDGGDIAEGGVFKSTCDQNAPDVQGEFVDVTFTNDAVCVAWITVTEHDGSPGGVWTGDIGSSCDGGSWYYQTQVAGQQKNGSEYIPNCTWFDGDHTSSNYASMKFHVRAYGNDGANETIMNNHACASTLNAPDNTPIDGTPAKRAKRDTSIRPAWMSEQLIISSIPQHSSKILCDSETSWGPDFIDSTGMHCDAGTKTLSPLCSAQNVTGCLTLDGTSLKKRTAIGKREVQLDGKTYAYVKQW